MYPIFLGLALAFARFAAAFSAVLAFANMTMRVFRGRSLF